MDFRHRISGPEALAAVDADALLLVVCGDAVPALLAPALAALKSDDESP